MKLFVRSLICLVCAASASWTLLSAASFTAGSVVVVRVGTGSAALGSTATATFLDEYNPTTGTLIQSIALPTADSGANRTFTNSGTATSEGALMLSSDGQYLVLAGYAAAPGTAGVATSASSAVNRVIARVSPNGTVDTTTSITVTAAGGNNIRAAATDSGANLWVGGAPTTSAGTYLATFGGANSAITSLIGTNTRVVNIFGGQLYYSTGSGTAGVYQLGTGLPTTTGQTASIVAASGSPYAFYFVDLSPTEAGLDTLYVADDTAGQIKKFTKSAGVWAAAGTATFATVRGLTGSVNGSTVTLYGTNGSTLGTLTDASGYGGTLSGSASTLVTAATNTALRGIAFAPQSASPTNPSATGAATSVTAGSATAFSGTITAGANPVSTGLAVSCDLTQVGGSASFAMTVSGNGFTGGYTVPGGTAANTYTLPCAVSDSQSRSANFNISLSVTLVPAVTISPTTLTSATEGTSYLQSFTPVNGTSCTFAPTGTVPPGLTLNVSGVLSGTPTLAGTFNFSVGATCSNGNASQSVSLTVAFACETGGVKTSTAIHTIQGTGATSLLAGQSAEIEGIVVGSFQGATNLNGFYLQEPDSSWDTDPLSSEGIFVFDNGVGAAVNIGDRVRVAGAISEFSTSGSFLGVTQSVSLTEIGTLTNKLVCSTGNTFTRTTISLPTANAGDLERYEGMAVQFTQQLTVTGNFSLGTFGQVDLAPALQYTPTASAGNSTTWAAATALLNRSVIQMDDASNQSNTALYPTVFPQGGLSASNTLRAGDLVNYDSGTNTVSPLVGVLDNRFGAPRILPTGTVTFYSANPRPAIAPILTSVGGRFRAVSANVLNFFTTLGSRGAATQTEFDHQKTKIVEALAGMNGDVYGLSEVQNFANGSTSGGTYTNAALQSLVDGLNCKNAGFDAFCTGAPSTPVSPYAMVDTLNLGASNGTDAIRSALIYRSDRLAAVGSPALYYQNDTNRPSLAQTFRPASGLKASAQTFTFVVNHFRSKGSACGSGSDDPFQGNCNGLRLNMAQNVNTWLAGNPTSDPAATRRLLLVGDFNAYYGEDPIQFFNTNGYTNLINAIIGTSAYSYNFGSQAGYLDHAIANGPMNLLVRSVAEWHNNADEPSSLQALNSSVKSATAQTAYYAATPWAASDHDPIVIGFNPLAGDLNDDGIVDASDGRLVTAAVGKTVNLTDRRMDYDGDGRITLNDYRIWANNYKSFQQ